MATKTKRTTKRRKPPDSRLFTSSRRADTADENGKYLIKYCVSVPYLLGSASYSRVPTLRLRVRGRRNMESSRAALRSAGYKIISVTRTNWFD